MTEQQIDDLALGLNASSFHVLLAVLYVYFTRAYQRDELVIGLPILNRPNASYKKTLGLFTQLSSVRLKFSADLSFGELVQASAGRSSRITAVSAFPSATSTVCLSYAVPSVPNCSI